MSIAYSLSFHKNPQKPDEPQKCYATAQGKETLDIDKFAEHITSHGCVYSKADIAAVLTMAVYCIREQILAGNVVKLGELGKFSARISSRGASEFDSFIPATNIKTVSVRWTPTPQLRQMKQYCDFERVLTKKDAAEAKAKVYGN